ncbi:MAG: hypothetical protein KJZ92_09565 [Rhodocyclaceae bacterium]|jgi:hypothetical protein|nr:hypothetical protein [Rhodocyclaceae bacterium]MCL4681511.1 hypothetical protein [Rhodocyclaceae bacterium]
MSNHIHQLNASYNAAEDRILLRLNTTNKDEFRIWLTRRVMRRLAEMLGSAERRLLGLENPEHGLVTPGARAIQDFRREASTAGVNFGERFVEETAGFPFGEAPVLATGCEVHPQDENAVVSLQLANKSTLTFLLDVRGIHGTLAMLQKAVAHSEWNLMVQELEGSPLPVAERSGLH